MEQEEQGECLSTYKNLTMLFGEKFSRSALNAAEKQNKIPKAVSFKRGVVEWRGWRKKDIPEIGAKFGFLKKILPKEKKINAVVTSYSSKGGVLKTTLALTIARTAALHNIKTCIVGLDMNGDITSALGHDNSLEGILTVSEASEILDKTKGLYDIFTKRAIIDEVIVPADMPSLFYIPETDEIEELVEDLKDEFERDYWLEDNIVIPLRKKGFDLIVFDCAPTSGRLVDSAIASSDLIVSPVQCKINHYRGIKRFIVKLNRVKERLKLSRLNILIVPTGLSKSKVLSQEIFERYKKEVPHCIGVAVPESVYGDEAMAQNISVLEYPPAKEVAKGMRDMMKQIFQKLVQVTEDISLNYNATIRSKRKDQEFVSSPEIKN